MKNFESINNYAKAGTSAPKISIIVPIYNGSFFLLSTLRSLQGQTFKNFEVLCVEDMSSDNSASIVQKIAEQDPRFKLIKRDHRGGNAVKGIIYALPLCQGEYFFYLSQDDLLSDDCLALMYDRATETGADVVLPKMDWFYDDGEDHGGIYAPNGDLSLELKPEEAFLLSLNWSLHGFSLRKMEKVRSIGYDDLYFNSDEYVTRRLFLKSNKVVFSGGTFFYRQNNPQAITKQIRGFTFEALVTESRVSWLLLRHHFPRHVKKQRIRSMIELVHYFQKLYDEHISSLSPKEKSCAENIIEMVKKDICKMALRQYWFRIAWRVLKRNLWN